MTPTIKFLGTGSAFNFNDGNVSAVISYGERKILLDCGTTVPEALKSQDLLNEITDIFISHTHSDHIGGLELLAQWRYFVGQNMNKKVPQLIVHPKILPLLRKIEETGLGFIQDDFGRPVKATLETYFDIRESEYWRFENEGTRLNIFYIPCLHVPGNFPSFSFVIDYQDEDKKWYRTYFTADTREVANQDYLNPEHQTIANIFHDCQLFTGKNEGAGDVHISLERLKKEMPEEMKPKTWLVHYGQNWKAFEQDAFDSGFKGFVERGNEFSLKDDNAGS